MSLKNFHYLFIILAILLLLGFGAWALLMPRLSDAIRVMGWVSVAMGVGLLGYGIYFLRKAKSIIT